MALSNQDFTDILNVGIGLTVEKDSNVLLNTIVEKGMEITNCDAAVLYIYEDHVLKFRIMRMTSRNLTEEVRAVEQLPPVLFQENHVCAYTAIHRKVVNIPDIYHSREFDFSGSRWYDTKIGYHTKSMMVIPMENNGGELLGVFQLINAQNPQGEIISFCPEYEIIIRSLGSLAAITLTNIAYVQTIKKQLQSFVEAMATAIDERTPYNGTHTRKVAEYAVILAKKVEQKHQEGKTALSFDEQHLEKLRLAALLHDFGKMIVPRSVMNRATRLDKDMEALEDRYKLLRSYYEIDFLKGRITEETYDKKISQLEKILEFIHTVDDVSYLNDENYNWVQKIGNTVYIRENGERIPYLTDQEKEHLSIRRGTLTAKDRRLMESHVVMTSKILSKVYFSKEYEDVPRWAGQHHEFLDGTGYPNHLRGDQLSPETRILTISDIYDALTSPDRPYKKPMSRENAFFVLHGMAAAGKLEGTLVNWLEEAVYEQINNEE